VHAVEESVGEGQRRRFGPHVRRDRVERACADELRFGDVHRREIDAWAQAHDLRGHRTDARADVEHARARRGLEGVERERRDEARLPNEAPDLLVVGLPVHVAAPRHACRIPQAGSARRRRTTVPRLESAQGAQYGPTASPVTQRSVSTQTGEVPSQACMHSLCEAGQTVPASQSRLAEHVSPNPMRPPG
jgi:hypothetical protein